VEASHGSDHFDTLGAEAGEFKRSFHGFGPRITQEDAFHTLGCQFNEAGKKFGAAIVVKHFWRGDQLVSLGSDRFGYCGVSVTQVRYAMSADAVDVLAALLIPKQCPFPAHDGQLALRINPGCVLFFDGESI
jgi:hypothetical protein